MARGTFFDRWLIDLATTNPPAGREEWARAMRAEFETLERGRTGWALGCLSASLGWRLRSNLGFLLAFVAVALCLDQLSLLIVFPLVIGLHFWLPHSELGPLTYAMSGATLAIASGAFAAVRPRHWPAIGIGMTFFNQVGSLVWFSFFFGKTVSIRRLHIMDAPIEVGIGACLGYSLVGALIGQSLAGVFRRPALKPPASA
jgi:hypothetical protein